MAQINENLKPSEEHPGDELLSSEEWTIIGDKESSDNISIDSSKENNKMNNNTADNHDNDNNNDDDDADNDGEDDEESTAEVAREAIQVLGDQESDINYGEEESQMPEALIADKFPALKDDDSDGISVITESERNDDSICKCITEIVKIKDNVTTITPTTCIHIIIACLLAVSIGFGIGWYVSLEKPQMPTNNVNFKPAKNGKLLNDINKLNLDDSLVILNSNPELASVMSKHILNEVQKPFMNDGNSNENFLLGDLLKNVNIFIDTLCTMIDNINFESTGINYKCNHTAFNLMSLKNNIKSINMLTKLTEENPHPRFQDNIKSKIDDVSVSFVNDLSRSIESSVRKMNQKLNKIKYKLHHKVCLMESAIKNNLNSLDGMKQIKDLGINCTYEFAKQEPNFELKTKGEKRNFKKSEKVYSHPIGPDVKQKSHYKNKKVESNVYPDKKQSNERMVESQEEYKGSKQYKKRKIERKYNDKNSSEYSESKVSDNIDDDLQKSFEEISPIKYKKNQDDWKKYAKRDYENTCHTKSCMNQKNKDRKYSQERSNGNWQFKRSEGRDNWRTENKADVETISWDHNRSKARENARLKY